MAVNDNTPPPPSGGFMSGFLSVAKPRLDEAHNEEVKQRDMERDFFWNKMNDGGLAVQPGDDPATVDQKQRAYQFAQQEYLKRSGKSAKGIVDKISPFFQKVYGHRFGPNDEKASVASAPGAPTDHVAQVTTQQAGVPAQPTTQPTVEDKDNPSQPAASAQAPSVTPPPSAQPPAAPPMTNASLAGIAQQSNDARELANKSKYEKVVGDQWVRRAQAQAAAMQARTRSIPGKPISITDAIKVQAQTGAPLMGMDQEPLDLSNYDSSTQMLVPFIQGNQVVGYMPASQSQRFVTYGNQVHPVSQFGMLDTANGNTPAAGLAKVPTVGTHEQVAIGPDGQLVKNTLTTTSTPVMPKGGAPSVSAPPAGGAGARRTGTGAGTGAAGARQPIAAGTGTPGGGGTNGIRGVPIAQANTFQQRVTPLREASTSLFGDPDNPSYKGLVSYASLADSPDSRGRLGEAIRLTLDGLEQNEKSSGGLMTLLKNYGGLPNAIAASQSQVQQNAINKLLPAERQAYDATMTAFGTIIGLRSMTKASAAQASVKKLENELPLIGVNTNSSSQFYDQAMRIAQQIHNGAKQLPVQIMPQNEKDAIAGYVTDMSNRASGGKQAAVGKQAGKSVVAPSPPPGKAPTNAQEYMQSIGAAAH